MVRKTCTHRIFTQRGCIGRAIDIQLRLNLRSSLAGSLKSLGITTTFSYLLKRLKLKEFFYGRWNNAIALNLSISAFIFVYSIQKYTDFAFRQTGNILKSLEDAFYL